MSTSTIPPVTPAGHTLYGFTMGQVAELRLLMTHHKMSTKELLLLLKESLN